MGRPINSKFFAPASGPSAASAADGLDIKVDFRVGGANKVGHIVKQLGSKKFQVAEIGSSDALVVCTLTTGTLSVNNTMTITVKSHETNQSYHLTKISGRTATVKKIGTTGVLDGEKVSWDFAAAVDRTSDATRLSKVEIEQAGNDDVVDGDEDNFTDAG